MMLKEVVAVKAYENIKRYSNENGPDVTVVGRKIIEDECKYFKDIDGTGKISAVNDWRNPPSVRAAAYASVLSVEEKIGLLFTAQCRMGMHAHLPNPMLQRMGAEFDVKVDETGILDETVMTMKTIFGRQTAPGTTESIKKLFQRNMIFRENPQPEDLVKWIDQLQAVAEVCEHFVPVQIMSNSRNENGEIVFGMNDGAGVFPAWPGTLGIAAAVRGDSMEVVDKWADAIRRGWNAVGIKKGYMYMADLLTDPRWQRNYGTFGEDPQLIADIMSRIVPGIQGSEGGVTADGVALTVKHFPGGGARENGFDPHYKMGQWNVYGTKDSLMKYHLPPFRAAVDKNVASIMPYYAKPSEEKSGIQTDEDGSAMSMEPFGFAFNRPFINDLLRKRMGFKGYVNSDTGIIHNMAWGVEKLDTAERIAFAVNHAGVDIISGMMDVEAAKEAYERGKNGYYRDHDIPEGFTEDMLVLTDEALDRAAIRVLESMFAMGLFEDPYRDADAAAAVVADAEDRQNAMDAHRKSVVLLKNDGTLPLKKGIKVYAEAFAKNPETAAKSTEALRGMLKDVIIVDKPEDAEVALLMTDPSSGSYFSATKGYLELDICENKTVCDVDDDGRPTEGTHTETTLHGADRIKEIAEKVHAAGGKVAANVNVKLPWLMGNAEPFCDALTVGFDTYPSAILDVVFGNFAPCGRLPLTLPRNDAVIAVDENGRCISPNDVPGYDKDKYLPDDMKDENGKAYAYRDGNGNYYELNFGLSY